MKTSLTPLTTPPSLIKEFVNQYGRLAEGRSYSKQEWRDSSRSRIDFSYGLMNFLAAKKHIASDQPTKDDLLKFRLAHEAALEAAEQQKLFTRRLTSQYYQKEGMKKQAELAHAQLEQTQKDQVQQIELMIQEEAAKGKEKNQSKEDKSQDLIMPLQTKTPALTAKEKKAFSDLGLNPETVTYLKAITKFEAIQEAHVQNRPFDWGNGISAIPSENDVNNAHNNLETVIRYLEAHYLANDPRLEGLAEEMQIEGDGEESDDEQIEGNGEGIEGEIEGEGEQVEGAKNPDGLNSQPGAGGGLQAKAQIAKPGNVVSAEAQSSYFNSVYSDTSTHAGSKLGEGATADIGNAFRMQN